MPISEIVSGPYAVFYALYASLLPRIDVPTEFYLNERPLWSNADAPQIKCGLPCPRLFSLCRRRGRLVLAEMVLGRARRQVFACIYFSLLPHRKRSSIERGGRAYEMILSHHDGVVFQMSDSRS